MAKNTVPEAKEALNRFKMEAASEVGVNLKQGYNQLQPITYEFCIAV